MALQAEALVWICRAHDDRLRPGVRAKSVPQDFVHIPQLLLQPLNVVSHLLLGLYELLPAEKLTLLKRNEGLTPLSRWRRDGME